MDRSLRWRSFFLFAVIAYCVLNLLPSVLGKSLPSAYPFKKQIQLGLDLQGGFLFDYSIDLDTAIDDKASAIKHDIENHIADEKLTGKVTTPSGLGFLSVTMDSKENADAVSAWVSSQYAGVVVGRDCGTSDPNQTCFRVSSDYADSIKDAALKQAIETIRSRIDEKGIAEPTVISKGDDIIVELPGLDKERKEETKDLIARSAKLEFKMVRCPACNEPTESNDDFMQRLFKTVRTDADGEAKKLQITAESDQWSNKENGKNYSDYDLRAPDREEPITEEDAKKKGCYNKDTFNGYCNKLGSEVIDDYVKEEAAKDPTLKLADDKELRYEYNIPPQAAEDQTPYWRSYYLEKSVQLTGASITDAITFWDPQTNRPEVEVSFDRSGTNAFGDMTTKHVGWKMAIILDGKVKSAPVIEVPITGGRSSITMGQGTADEQQKESDALVTVLKTGSLPAPLRLEQESDLGPTLGRDAIQKTQFSFILGVILVLAIMMTVYRFSGLIAIGAMFINILITLTAMAIFGATLTLPGIAALVLTVGMAVDGNIIIYERIRDELHLGKSVKGAVDIGFARAFTTVLDGHVTTAAAGWVLLQYGSGPIQGFATMLLVGIGTTLFTTTWVSRVFFDWYVVKNKASGTISI